MKKNSVIKWIVIFISIFIGILAISCKGMEIDTIELTSSKQNVSEGEEVEIIVNSNNAKVASLTLQIYFDMAKLEYIDKTQNVHFSQNRVIYTWVDQLGGDTNRNSKEIEKFRFKALREGIANVVVTGEFYDKEGNKIPVEDGNIQIQIGEQAEKPEEQRNQEEQENQENEEQQLQQVSADNTNLKILRLNEEGISPEFQKGTKTYYFVADNSLNDLEITAIPENPKSTVKITGNTGMKQGLNTIKIEVTSEDKTKQGEYIIYVTKTSNPELANSNLENLAVRETMLYPPFDPNITQYEIELSKDIEKVDILAIPQKANATVTIKGNDTLKVGDNTITINVLAEDKMTSKQYIIKAHRRNEEEEIEAKEEQDKQTEQLAAILSEETEEKDRGKEEIKEEHKQKETKIKVVDVITWGLVVLVIIGFTIGFFVAKRKNKI